jgi:hypothetical protein
MEEAGREIGVSEEILELRADDRLVRELAIEKREALVAGHLLQVREELTDPAPLLIVHDTRSFRRRCAGESAALASSLHDHRRTTSFCRSLVPATERALR